MWYRKAANQGLAEAQFSLGLAYDYGQGVPHDDFKAVEWARKAADQGFARAQGYLASMYYFGRGASKDINMAKRLWLLAIENGDGQAKRDFDYYCNPTKRTNITAYASLDDIDYFEDANCDIPEEELGFRCTGAPFI